MLILAFKSLLFDIIVIDSNIVFMFLIELFISYNSSVLMLNRITI